MAKQNFTPDGVKGKSAELNALPDASLQTQVNLMRSDFKSWLTGNFNFNTGQLTYLNGMDTRFILAAGAVTGTAASARQPISLIAPTPPGGYSSKFIVISDGLNPSYDSVEGYHVTGSLQFTIGYNA